MCAARWYSSAAPSEIARTLLDVAEQVVELARVLHGQHAGDLLARLGELAGLEQGEREVVAVGVLGRVDGAARVEGAEAPPASLPCCR